MTARTDGIMIKRRPAVYPNEVSGARPFKVLLCLFTLAAFLVNTVYFDVALLRPLGFVGQAWAVGKTTELTGGSSDSTGGSGSLKELHVGTFTLPQYLGTVRDSWQSPQQTVDHRPKTRTREPTNPQTIIHIQDAHCNYAAQHKIAEIIEYLNKEYGIDTINLEGGAKDYDLSIFTGIYDKTIREKTADYFVKEGLVNGAEYFAVNNSEKVTLWGVEDTRLYLDNLNVYRESLKHKEEVDKHLNAVSRILANLKTKIYSQELLELDAKYLQYKAGSLEFKDYLTYLIQTAKQRAIEIKTFTNVYLLSQTLAEEGNIDFKKANNQRDDLIDKLQKRLSKKSLEELVLKTVEFRTERISQKDFYAYLAKKAGLLEIELSEFPEFQKYIIYIFMYDAIDKIKVMEEIDRLEDEIKAALYRNDKEKELNKLSKNLAILKNIFNISLTKEDYRHYLDNEQSFDIANYVSFINKEAPLHKITAQLADDINDLDGQRESISKFYEYSFKRDMAFLKNMRLAQSSRLKAQGDKNNLSALSFQLRANHAAILITGGFHTENLCEAFKERNISYVSIMPAFSNGGGYECPYFSLLKGETGGIGKAVYSVLSGPSSAMATAALSTTLGKEVWGERNIREFELWKALVVISIRDNWPIDSVDINSFSKKGDSLEFTVKGETKSRSVAITDLIHQAGEIIDEKMADFRDIAIADTSRVRAVELAFKLGRDVQQGIDNLDKGAEREGHRLHIQEVTGLPDGQNEHAGGYGISIRQGLAGGEKTEAILHGIVAGFVEDHSAVDKIVKALLAEKIADAQTIFNSAGKHRIGGAVTALWDMTPVQRQSVAAKRDFAAQDEGILFDGMTREFKILLAAMLHDAGSKNTVRDILTSRGPVMSNPSLVAAICSKTNIANADQLLRAVNAYAISISDMNRQLSEIVEIAKEAEYGGKDYSVEKRNIESILQQTKRTASSAAAFRSPEGAHQTAEARAALEDIGKAKDAREKLSVLFARFLQPYVTENVYQARQSDIRIEDIIEAANLINPTLAKLFGSILIRAPNPNEIPAITKTLNEILILEGYYIYLSLARDQAGRQLLSVRLASIRNRGQERTYKVNGHSFPVYHLETILPSAVQFFGGTDTGGFNVFGGEVVVYYDGVMIETKTYAGLVKQAKREHPNGMEQLLVKQWGDVPEKELEQKIFDDLTLGRELHEARHKFDDILSLQQIIQDETYLAHELSAFLGRAGVEVSGYRPYYNLYSAIRRAMPVDGHIASNEPHSLASFEMVRRLFEKAEARVVPPSEVTYNNTERIALALGSLTERQIITYCREIYREVFNADLNVGSFIVGHKKYNNEDEALKDFVATMEGAENITQRKLMIGVVLVNSGVISEEQAKEALESQRSPEELGYELTPDVMKGYLELRRPENYEKFSSIRERIVPVSRFNDYVQAAADMRQKTIDFLNIFAGIGLNGAASPTLTHPVAVTAPSDEDIRSLWRTSTGLSAYWDYISQDKVNVARYMKVIDAIASDRYEDLSVGELIRALAFFTQFGREIGNEQDVTDLLDMVDSLRTGINYNVMASGGMTRSGYMEYILISRALNNHFLRNSEAIRPHLVKRIENQPIPALAVPATYSGFQRLLAQEKERTQKVSKPLIIHGKPFGLFFADSNEIALDFDRARSEMDETLQAKMPELKRKLSDNELIAFVHVHEMFHSLENHFGKNFGEDAADAFAARALGLPLAAEQAVLLAPFDEMLRTEETDEAILELLNKGVINVKDNKDGRFLLALSRLGIDILNIRRMTEEERRLGTLPDGAKAMTGATREEGPERRAANQLLKRLKQCWGTDQQSQIENEISLASAGHGEYRNRSFNPRIFIRAYIEEVKKADRGSDMLGLEIAARALAASLTRISDSTFGVEKYERVPEIEDAARLSLALAEDPDKDINISFAPTMASKAASDFIWLMPVFIKGIDSLRKKEEAATDIDDADRYRRSAEAIESAMRSRTIAPFSNTDFQSLLGSVSFFTIAFSGIDMGEERSDGLPISYEDYGNLNLRTMLYLGTAASGENMYRAMNNPISSIRARIMILLWREATTTHRNAEKDFFENEKTMPREDAQRLFINADQLLIIKYNKIVEMLLEGSRCRNIGNLGSLLFGDNDDARRWAARILYWLSLSGNEVAVKALDASPEMRQAAESQWQRQNEELNKELGIPIAQLPIVHHTPAPDKARTIISDLIPFAEAAKIDRGSLVKAMRERIAGLIGQDPSKGPVTIRSILSAISGFDHSIRNELEMTLRTVLLMEGISYVTPQNLNVVVQFVDIGQGAFARPVTRQTSRILGKPGGRYNGIGALPMIGEGIGENDIQKMEQIIKGAMDAMDESANKNSSKTLFLLPPHLQKAFNAAAANLGLSGPAGGIHDTRMKAQLIDQGKDPDVETQFMFGIEVLEHVRRMEQGMQDEQAEQALLNLIATLNDGSEDPKDILKKLFEIGFIFKIRKIDWKSEEEKRKAWEAVATAL